MKKSKKFILGVIVILIAAIAIILANPDWVDSGEDISNNQDIELSEEIENDVFD